MIYAGLKLLGWRILLIMREWRQLSLWAILLAMVLIAVQSLTVLAAPTTVYDFRLTQGAAKLPFIKAYADIIGAGDVPAKGLQKEDLKAKIASTAVKVSRLIPFEDTKEGIGYVLLVDVSKSLSPAQFAMMKETLTAFVDAMSERDQAALVTFGTDVKLIQEFSPNRSNIKEKLTALGPTDEETAFYGGLEKAISVARTASAEVPGRRVVITLTDGVNDLAGGVGKGDVSAKLSSDPIPLYLIGYVQGRPTAEEESAIGVMKNFASQSGGRFYDGRGGSWRGIYFAITRSIRSAFVIELDSSGFRSEGAVYPLEISLTATNRTWTSKLQLTVPAGGTTTVPQAKEAAAASRSAGSDRSGAFTEGNTGLYSGIALTLVVLGIVWYWVRRRSSAAAPPSSKINEGPGISPIGGKSAVSGVLLRLTRIHEGPSPQQFDLEITDRVVLGRDPAVSHLVFENEVDISPAHCEFVFEDGYLYAHDLGSGQGTYLNGTLLTVRQKIDENDVLRIGRTELRITFPV